MKSQARFDGIYPSIRSLDYGKAFHGSIIQYGCESDVVIGSSIVDMYVKLKSLLDAEKAFNKLPNKNVVAWSALIAGYAENDQGHPALKCFEQMQSDGFSPDSISLMGILKACAIGNEIEVGVKIHDEIETRRDLLEKNIVLGTVLCRYVCERCLQKQKLCYKGSLVKFLFVGLH